jgi:phosphoribosylaminoimidazole-succinocarboxamide synthase
MGGKSLLMTSVKDFRVETPPMPGELGLGAFVFTDDYSVFDWGKMPDQIDQKGASLCSMGASNFELLEREGIGTHYEGVMTPSTDGTVDLDTALATGTAPRKMRIELTQVPDLPFHGEDTTDPSGYDYDAYHEAAGEHYLVPLEVVFRNRVPVGSSLRERTNPEDHGLAAEEWPDEPVDLADPVIEFSTKYEQQDRYLSRAAADRIAGRADLDDIEVVARAVNRLVTERASDAGFVHQDGKIECLYHRGEVRVADVVGTFDENRFAYDGQQVSKEVLRQYHKRTQPDWVAAVSAAKRDADRRGVADWKSLCNVTPDPLEESVLETARDLYCAGTNAYVGRDVFEAPSLEAAVATVRRL